VLKYKHGSVKYKFKVPELQQSLKSILPWSIDFEFGLYKVKSGNHLVDTIQQQQLL